MDVSYYGDVMEVAKQTAYDLASVGEMMSAQIMMPHPDDKDTVLVLTIPPGITLRDALHHTVTTFKPIFWVAFAETRVKEIPADDTQIVIDAIERGDELPERYQNIVKDVDNPEVLIVTGRVHGELSHTHQAYITTDTEGERTIGDWTEFTGLGGALSEIDW